MPLLTPPTAWTPNTLTPAELTALDQPSATTAYLSIIPRDYGDFGDMVVTARINKPGGWAVGDEIVDIPVDNTSAAWGVYAGSAESHGVVWIGTAAGLNDVGVYAIRKAETSTFLYIEEASRSDPGLKAFRLQTNYIDDNQYITLFRPAFNIISALTRIVYAGTTGTFYKFFDKVYNYETWYWEPLVNWGPNKAVFVDSGVNYATVSFQPYVLRWDLPVLWDAGTPNNRPLNTYGWQIITSTGYSVVVDTLTGATSNTIAAFETFQLTLHLNPGFHCILFTNTYQQGAYAPAVTLFDRITDNYRFIWVHDGQPGDPNATFPPIAVASVDSDSRNTTARTIQLTLNDIDFSNQTDLALVHYWEDPRWSGQEVPTASRRCTGWVTDQRSEVREGLKQTHLTVESLGAMLEKLPASSHRTGWMDFVLAGEITGDVNTWNWQVLPDYFGGEIIAYYILRYHSAGVLALFDYYPYAAPGYIRYDSASSLWQTLGQALQVLGTSVSGDDLTGAFGTEGTIGATIPAGTILSQIKEILRRYTLEFGVDSDGTMWLRPHPSMVPYSYRIDAAIPLRDTLDETIYTSVSWGGDPFAKVRKLNGSAFCIGTDGVATPLLSVWPGQSMAHGSIEENMNDLVVTEQRELDFLVGQKAARLNNPLADLSVEIAGNRDVFEPAHFSLVGLNVPAALSPTGSAMALRCILKSVSKRIGESGTVDLTLNMEAETTGQPGTPVAIPDRIHPPPPPPPGGEGGPGTGCDPWVSSGASDATITSLGGGSYRVTGNTGYYGGTGNVDNCGHAFSGFEIQFKDNTGTQVFPKVTWSANDAGYAPDVNCTSGGHVSVHLGITTAHLNGPTTTPWSVLLNGVDEIDTIDMKQGSSTGGGFWTEFTVVC